MQANFFEAVFDCIMLTDPEAKCQRVGRLAGLLSPRAIAAPGEQPARRIEVPGRPGRPELVDPARVARRRLGGAAGRAALVHAITHIEFNAINLALDAAYRFRGMPLQFYEDWLSVAVDEARHFGMLQARLAEMGSAYGDFSAHNGLWEMAVKTADSCLVRMALVPRVLEARGLDVTPGMMKRLKSAGDEQTVAVLEVILEEEVRHVEIGTRWFRYCCEQQSKEPLSTFLGLLEENYSGTLRGPFNLEARYQAGFTKEEMSALTAGL
jgi:uncharacterized ferritin-like protein (DUF455 family)